MRHFQWIGPLAFGAALLAGIGCSSASSTANGDADADGDTDADVDVDGASDGDTDRDADDAPCDHPVCDLWPQCGCGRGQACVHEADGARTCSPAGTAAHGEECSAGDDVCAPGTLCAGFGDEPPYCAQYCNVDRDCRGLGEGTICELAFANDAGEEVARSCTLSCDPVAEEPGCAPGIRCDLFARTATGQVFTLCAGRSGAGTAWDPCDLAFGDSDCAPGHFCSDSGFGGECIRRCEVGDDSVCGWVELCNPFETPAVVGTIEYGFCY